MSRWVELYATSPSGKTLFMCRMCGRTSPTPDRDCATPPSTVSWKMTLPCSVLEELEAACQEEGGVTPQEYPYLEVYYNVAKVSGRVTLVYKDGKRKWMNLKRCGEYEGDDKTKKQWRDAVQAAASASPLALELLWQDDDPYDLKEAAEHAMSVGTKPEDFFHEVFAEDLARHEADELDRSRSLEEEPEEDT